MPARAAVVILGVAVLGASASAPAADRECTKAVAMMQLQRALHRDPSTPEHDEDRPPGHHRGTGRAARPAAPASADAPAVDYGHPAWLGSCRAIFLDVGSNIGVQVRKLFEPRRYPGAKLLPFFDEAFGPPARRSAPSDSSGLCALGMEPNPIHQERLRTLERSYSERGWHVHFYPLAASSSDGTAPFSTDPASAWEDWGAGLDGGGPRQPADAAAVDVTTVDFGRFLTSLPKGVIAFMKMDIEGAEYGALDSLARHRAACAEWVPRGCIEEHAFGDKTHWNSSFASVSSFLAAQSYCRGGTMRLDPVDDESYLHDARPIEPSTS